MNMCGTETGDREMNMCGTEIGAWGRVVGVKSGKLEITTGEKFKQRDMSSVFAQRLYYVLRDSASSPYPDLPPHHQHDPYDSHLTNGLRPPPPLPFFSFSSFSV